MTVSVFHRAPADYSLPLLVPGWTAVFDGAPMQTKYEDYRIIASGVVTETATGRRYRFHCQADRAGFPLPSDRFGFGDVQLNYVGKRAGAPVNGSHIPDAWAIVRAAWHDLCIAIRDERVTEDTESLSGQERRARRIAREANREGLEGDRVRRASDKAAEQMPHEPATAEPEAAPLLIKLTGGTVIPAAYVTPERAERESVKADGPAAEIVADADAIGSLSVMQYDVGSVYFPDDAHALRSYIESTAEPVAWWTRPALDVPFVKSALPSRVDAETWAAPSRVDAETISESPVRRDNVEYHAGRDAWAANQTKGSNPYPAGGTRAERWNLGWQEACDSSAPVSGTIDLTPTWAEMATVILALVENGNAAGRATVIKELGRMAALADQRNKFAERLARIAGILGADWQGDSLCLQHMVANALTVAKGN